MGTSWDLSPSFVQAALHAGVRYIDTSETYEGGNCETTLGEVLERTKMRKDVYLVTKNSRGKVGRCAGVPHFREASEREPGAAANRLHRLLLPPRRRGQRDRAAQRSRRQGRIREAEEIRQDQVLRAFVPRRPAARDRHGRRRERLDRPDHDPVQLPHDDHRRGQDGPSTRRQRPTWPSSP